LIAFDLEDGRPSWLAPGVDLVPQSHPAVGEGREEKKEGRRDGRRDGRREGGRGTDNHSEG